MMLTYAAQIRGLLADYDTPTGLIWEMWAKRHWFAVHLLEDSEEGQDQRGGLVCLNSAARFDKWNRAAVR